MSFEPIEEPASVRSEQSTVSNDSERSIKMTTENYIK